MHFRWDSSVARDIAKELDRLQEELSDCEAEIDRCATILLDMANGPDELIEKYLAVAENLKKGVKRMEERFHETSRGIDRASELFERVELELYRKAEGSGDRLPTFIWGSSDTNGIATGPVFYNIPNVHATTPVGVGEGAPIASWPALEGIGRAIVIDQVTPGGVVTPPWLLGIVESDYEQRRNH